MKMSEQVNELIAALAKARPHFKKVEKSRENKHLSTKYADMSDYIDATADALAAVGVVPVSGTEPLDDGHVLLFTRLFHTSGQWMENSLIIPAPPNMQQLGGNITYARKYTYGPLLNVFGEMDDDGEASAAAVKSEPKRPVARYQRPERGVQNNQTVADADPGAHPTKDHIDSLKELAQCTDPKLTTWVTVWGQALELPLLREASDNFLRGKATMAQYKVVWDHYNGANRDAVAIATDRSEDDEEDVPDFPSVLGHNAQERPKEPTGEERAGALAADEHSPTGPAEANNGTSESQDMVRWGRLSLRAKRAGMPEAEWDKLRESEDYPAAVAAVQAIGGAKV